MTDVSAQRAIEPGRGRAPHDRIARALDARLRTLDPDIRGWAAHDCRAHGDRGLAHVDDVANLVRWECARLLRPSIGADEASAPSLRYLRQVARNAADRYFHSSARTGLAGATGAARRTSRARTTAGALVAELGRMPTTAEVVAAVNRDALAARVDAVKQGALIRDAGSLLLEPVALDERLAGGRALDDDVHRRIEAEAAVRRTIALCRAMSDELGAVADLWLSGSLAEPPSIPTVAEIAELSSRRPDEVRELLDECRIVAELVCLELGLGPN